MAPRVLAVSPTFSAASGTMGRGRERDPGSAALRLNPQALWPFNDLPGYHHSLTAT